MSCLFKVYPYPAIIKGIKFITKYFIFLCMRTKNNKVLLILVCWLKRFVVCQPNANFVLIVE